MERLRSIPFFAAFLAFAAYLGYQFYTFNYAADGEIEQHKTAMQNSQSDIDGLKKKLTEGKRFMASLELKKAEIQAQVKKLIAYQGALSEAPDVPSLLNLLLTEAKKLDMKVDRLEPGKKTQKEYYLEQEFKLEIRGSYQQLLLFEARIAQLQRILRVEAFDMKQSQNAISSRATTLTANLSIRAYQYTISKEDSIGKAAILK